MINVFDYSVEAVLSLDGLRKVRPVFSYKMNNNILDEDDNSYIQYLNDDISLVYSKHLTHDFEKVTIWVNLPKYYNGDLDDKIEYICEKLSKEPDYFILNTGKEVI